MTERARSATVVAATAVVFAGGGVAVGAAVAAPAQPAAPAAAASTAAPASYAGVVREVLPSVVLIRTSEGLGSGVVLDQPGNIVTNAHVAGKAATFQVQVAGDPAPRSAHLVSSYPPDDLAVIRVDNPSGLHPARFGDSDKVQAGDVVLAVGNPLGLSSSVTEGIVSATGRAVTEAATPGSPAGALPGAIQTSAAINPGNSGGALVDATGQVIGIPTLAATSPQGGSQAPGIGFAIPSNLARDIASQIISTGHVTNSHRAALGAQIATVTGADGTPAGAGIVTVTSGGPADKAGLRAGDVIRSVGNTSTPDLTALSQALAAAHPGQQVTVTIIRGSTDQTPGSDQEMTVKVMLAELPGS
jgi:S1-C subfamily serine protease